jgi:hypothetical protein
MTISVLTVIYILFHFFSDECCINVHVSALLDHWLDWDRPTVSDLVPTSHTQDPTTHIDQLIGQLGGLVDPIPRVLEYCSKLGCDVINRQDEEGKTLLHHLLAGKHHCKLTKQRLLRTNQGLANSFFLNWVLKIFSPDSGQIES